MAWHSSGETNTELVNNLLENGLISSSAVEQGFRNVDRKLFVPKGNEDIAYSDQPLKEGNIHISAPHIYCSALEALDLQPNSCMSFLNIGSGTGYLSCIAAEILGPRSLNVGVDIYEDVVQHCRNSINGWKSAKMTACGKRRASGTMAFNSHRDSVSSIPPIEIIHGNGLEISSCVGESVVGFDRIYIGASIEKADLPNIKSLLCPGGMIVGPVEDELVKIIRIGKKQKKDTDDDDSVDEMEFTTQVFSSVRFAALSKLPKMKTIIPARIWNPSSHYLYPESHQESIMSLLLCSSSEYIQPLRPVVKMDCKNMAATLPRDVWIHIISFTNRKWFEPEKTQTEFLRNRVREEQALTANAQQALLEAQARYHAAERERDIYRHMARRWHLRLQSVLRQQHHQQRRNTRANTTEINAESHSSTTASDPLSFSVPLLSPNDANALFVVGSARMLQLEGDFRLGSSDDDEDANDDTPLASQRDGDDTTMEEVDYDSSIAVREDIVPSNTVDDNTWQDDSPSSTGGNSQQHASILEESHTSLSDLDDMNAATTDDVTQKNTRQSRTVSISDSL